MGYLEGINGSLPWGSSSDFNYAGFTEQTKPASKYYDEYTTTFTPTSCNNGICYGHALSETMGWYSDHADFTSSGFPWLVRGGYFGSMPPTTGVFYFSSSNGGTNSGSDSGFRIVLVSV